MSGRTFSSVSPNSVRVYELCRIHAVGGVQVRAKLCLHPGECNAAFILRYFPPQSAEAFLVGFLVKTSGFRSETLAWCSAQEEGLSGGNSRIQVVRKTRKVKRKKKEGDSGRL